MNPRCRLALCVSLAVMLAPTWPASRTPISPGASENWWDQACRQIDEDEYRFSAGATGLEAPNRAQNLQTFAGGQGIAITPRTGGDPAWRWRWQTTAWGRQGRMQGTPPLPPAPRSARVEYARPGLVEWYENRREGIEQGFTISAPPPGEGRLLIEGQVAGLSPVASPDGSAIEFLDERGASVLHYGDLVVRDAGGREIEATLALSGATLSIRIDDRDAAYPLVVDPLMTSPAWGFESNMANAQLGFSVATAGDVNGDGYSDAIVGAPGYSNGGAESAGRVYVFLGSATGLNAVADWIAHPGALGGVGEFGESVGTAGDVNGDGYGDIIVGAPEFSDDANASEGHAYVWYGSASGLGAIGTAANADWEADSDNPQALLGRSVATAGDVNGDGYGDIVVGAPEYGGPNGEGAALVWLGSAGGLGPDGTPANADWRTEWTQADAQMGFSVATAGDVNGDGYADLILGAPGSENGQAGEGAAFVWLGGASGLGSNGNPLNADWFAEANQPLAAFGQSVATAGDVNGDGYADVVIGAPGYDSGSNNEGAAFIWLGSSSDLGANGSPANDDWSAEGNQPDAAFGTSVATAGDVNGDGFADVIAGAPGYDAGQNNEGRAYAYLGGTAGPEAAAFWIAEANSAGAGFGHSVATAGDVNADGYADAIVGAWLHTNGQANEGRAYAYHGSAGIPATSSAWRAEGGQDNAYFGYSLATAGDVNGDGYSDIIVGARNYANGQSGEGRALAYYGTPAGPVLAASWSVEGEALTAQLGSSVGSAGDVDGDGYSDVIVGAPGYAGGGAAFVYLGSATGLAAIPAWTGQGDGGGAQFGHSVASAGDVNGDGFADVIVGAPYHDNGQANEGRAYVYLGSADGLSATPAWIEERNQAGALFGSSVGSAGDVNGDGYSDVIVGAEMFDGSHIDEGRAWVFHGSPSGLSTVANWFGDVDQEGTRFGGSVAAAGDVNGDGFSDVLVGARLYDEGEADEGKAFLYLGSAAGLGASPAWTAESDQALAEFGASVAAAGDVNGDGFSDVVVGAERYSDDGQLDEGEAFLYLGGAAAPSSSPAWTAESNQSFARFGHAVAMAGDANGDGFGDVLTGAFAYTNPNPAEGRAFVYYGNEGDGRERRPRQARADDTAPIDLLGRSDSATSFRLKALGRIAAGRGRVRLEWEVKPLGVAFDGTRVASGIERDTGLPVGMAGSAIGLNEVVTGLTAARPYHWRIRTRADSPFFPCSPWLSLPYNSRTETDLRTPAQGTAVADPGPVPAPDGLGLLGVRPNPLPSGGTIAYVLPRAGRVRLAIYDVQGRQVAALVDEVEGAGPHVFAWDGRGSVGTPLASGVYFVRIEASRAVRTEKLVLTR